MKTVVLDSLSLTGYAIGKGFIIESIAGLEAPIIQTTIINKSGLDGVIVPTAYARERRIIINGAIIGKCLTDVITYRKQLAAKVGPERTNLNIIEPLSLDLTDFDNSTYTMDVVVAGLSFAREKMHFDRYQLDLIATDWRVFSGGAEHSNSIVPSIPGYFSIPFSIPFSFAGGTDNRENINNAGNVNAPLTISVTGIATNPRITNYTTDNYIEINYTLGALDTLLIDMGAKTVTINGSSAMTHLVTGSTFWELESGNNLIGISTGVGGETPTATINWRDAYGGI